MKLMINGEWQTFASDQALASILDSIGAKPPYAIAVNQTFVPRSQYQTLTMNDGDAIEIVQAMAGG
ncbi:sulfur carrier protein ThiS [Leeia sp. TBRC 13508]|uniref:Sulfur carrier protein ThiS n=1 Tax=Leeia speluncae TaxID=2884804 RepID=A0ABS8D7Q3_9NEIS|nr:sulfur carrier protein ThiS [Leeia speluncae]MCB6184235.1 sulfur carrier protein ThiS [Leeia speluncae]